MISGFLGAAVLWTASCSTISPAADPDYQDRLPDTCSHHLEDALKNFAGELYDQRRFDSEEDASEDVGNQSLGLMNCSVSFTSEDFDSTEVPIGRHAGFDYNIVTEEQGTGDPEEEATDRYLRTLDRAPNSATLLPIPGLGDEAHYWHQEEVPTGAHVSFRQHNLTVKVTVWGNDRNSTGEEVPMPQQEAEEAARHLAEAVFDNL